MTVTSFWKGVGVKYGVPAAFAAALFAALLPVPASYAQTTTGGSLTVKVQPALFEQVVNPGDQFSTSITVTNPEATTQKFTVGVQDISDVNDAGQPVFSTSSPEFGLSSWVTIPNPSITVPAHGNVIVPFTISIPKSASPGGHYGAIFISYGATRPTFTGTGIGYQVGALLELRIAGNALEQASIREFTTDHELYQTPNVTFNASVANEGNVLLQPRGPIDITNMFGQKVGTIVMNDTAASVFPGAERSFTVSWAGSGLAFGQFNAVMSLNYGDTNKTVSASTSFWVIPITPIIVVLLSIIFFVLIFMWSVKAYVRKRVDTMIEHGGRQDRSVASEEEKLLSGGLPLSRLVFIVIATAIFALIFLIALFFFFG